MKKAGPVWAAGAMSGTSLDGVDAALVLTDGARILEFGDSLYRPYDADERAILSAALGTGPDDPRAARAAEIVENAHAEVLSALGPADIVGFHGQTLWHRPDAGRTCQIGDGALLAQVLDRPVVWDFRSADMELGGQGAPLAPFFHHAALRWAGVTEPVAVLNIGGVANLTWADPRIALPQQDGALLAFDTGPGNAPLDDLMRARRGQPRDEGGALAAAGRADTAVIESMLARGYFLRMPPKSLDRGDFAGLGDAVAGLDDADAAATLAAAVAASVAVGLDHCPLPPAALYVTGGGRHNAAIMAMLAAGTGIPVEKIETLGLDGDMLEAQAFAHLAVRVARGMPTSAPSTTGVRASIGGGRLSRPDDATRTGLQEQAPQAAVRPRQE